MEKSWIIVVLTIGAFVSVDSLQCYRCVGCSSSDLLDSHLVTCSLEGLLPTSDILNATQTSDLEVGGKKASMVNTNRDIDFVCYSAITPGPTSAGIIVRGCGEASVCEYMDIANIRDCETCTTDRCNGAFKTQHSVAALLFVAIAVLFANKTEC